MRECLTWQGEISMDMNKSNSPYCKSCGACGESGCCTPLKCISKLINKNTDCEYGIHYIKEIELSLLFSEWVLSSVEGNNILTEKEVNIKYKKLMEELFRKDI